MSRSEFSEFKPQVLEVCQKYWSFRKTLPTWFTFAWPTFLCFVVAIGIVTIIYSQTGSVKQNTYYVGLAVMFAVPYLLSTIAWLVRNKMTMFSSNDEAVDHQLLSLVEAWNARLAGRGYLVYENRRGMRGEERLVRELRLNAGTQPPTQLGEPVAMPTAVVIPAGMGPGSIFQAPNPASGALFQVTVPDGMGPGMAMQVQPPPAPRATQQIIEKYKGTVALVSAGGDHSVALVPTQSEVHQESHL